MDPEPPSRSSSSSVPQPRPAWATLSMGLAQGASAPQPSLKLPECSLRPDQLRSLVLDYCIHHGYANTTKELLKLDAQTSPHDLSHAQADTEMGGPEHIMPASASQILTDLHLRSRITQLILSGLVPDAIHLLQLHFPQTLHIPNSPQSSGKDGMPSQDRPNKKPKRQASSGVTSPGSPETSGYAEESTHGCGDDGWLPHIPALRRATALAPVDLDTNATRILGLDLRIQTFIEAIRSTNFSTLSGNSSSSSNSSTSSDADGQNIAQILSMAYQTELNHASELFLYSSTDEAPESSHVRPLLDFARRQDLARRVNVAILESKGRPGQPALETIASRTKASWDLAHENSIYVTNYESRSGKEGVSMRGAENHEGKIRFKAPPFRFDRFLDDVMNTSQPGRAAGTTGVDKRASPS